MTTAQSSEQLRTSFMFNGAFSSLLFRSYPHGQITIPEIEFSTSLSLSLSLCVCVCVCVVPCLLFCRYCRHYIQEEFSWKIVADEIAQTMITAVDAVIFFLLLLGHLQMLSFVRESVGSTGYGRVYTRALLPSAFLWNGIKHPTS